MVENFVSRNSRTFSLLSVGCGSIKEQFQLRKLGMKFLGNYEERYRIGNEAIPTKEFAIHLSDWSGVL
jgi:hypothetical protein